MNNEAKIAEINKFLFCFIRYYDLNKHPKNRNLQYLVEKGSMASHNELGKQGEEMAVAYLLKAGYKILHCNWRFSRFEIDIIATKNEKLQIVEVKTLHASASGHPEDSVTKKKFRHLANAADEFLHQHPHFRHVQFNILSITLHKNKEPEYFLIEDVFL